MQHRQFIISPVKQILREATYNLAAQNWSIEMYPLLEHYFISIFLKLTGASEQKLKCVCWDIATCDYEYRYLTYSQSKVGECSCYDEKQKIVNDIYQQILKYEPNYDIVTDINRIDIRDSVLQTIESFYKYSGVKVWLGREYDVFEQYFRNVNEYYFLVKNPDKNTNKIFLLQEKKRDQANNIAGDDLYDIFDLAYKHRNRCAHNTLSYQENQYPLAKYTAENYKYENYFFRFAIMILIDEIVVRLYQKLLQLL